MVDGGQPLWMHSEEYGRATDAGLITLVPNDGQEGTHPVLAGRPVQVDDRLPVKGWFDDPPPDAAVAVAGRWGNEPETEEEGA